MDARVVDYEVVPFSAQLSDHRAQVGKVEDLSDAYHLRSRPARSGAAPARGPATSCRCCSSVHASEGEIVAALQDVRGTYVEKLAY